MDEKEYILAIIAMVAMVTVVAVVGSLTKPAPVEEYSAIDLTPPPEENLQGMAVGDKYTWGNKYAQGICYTPNTGNFSINTTSASCVDQNVLYNRLSARCEDKFDGWLGNIWYGSACRINAR